MMTKRTLSLGILIALLSASSTFAAKKCTTEPKEKWMKIEDFKRQKEAEGFVIRKFKQPGSCYEIYGTDKDGNDVEIYFNPVDGSVARRK